MNVTNDTLTTLLTVYQRRFDIEIALHHCLIGEQRLHGGGAEHVAPEL